MNFNLRKNVQLNFNLLNTLPQAQQLSPFRRKSIFSKVKTTLSPQSKQFNPHLERLNTNYYVKDNSIVPYSYTIRQNQMHRPAQLNPSKNLLKINKTKSSGSKILSLKEFSCIQTISQKSGKHNQSDSNNQLQISRTFKPKQINSEISSPFDFKNFQSTFTSANLKKSELNFIKSHQIPKNSQNSSQSDFFPIKQNKIKLFNNETENDKKTSKIQVQIKNKTFRNCTLQKRVVEVRISPTKKGLSFSKTIDVHESSVIFDYNKFYQKIGRSPQKKQSSIFHPINEKIFKFFGQEKQRDNTLRISNQNDSFIDIVKEINSPVNKVPYQQLFINKENLFTKLNGKMSQKDKLFSSDLTCLVKEGPRSYTVGNQLRKLSGHKNNYNRSKRQSITLKTQTIPTSGRSEFFNQVELHTPSKKNSQKHQNDDRIQFAHSDKVNFKTIAKSTSFNKIFLKTQDYQTDNKIKIQLDSSLQKNGNRKQNASLQNILIQQKTSAQLKSDSKDSKRRSSKGISVLSKQKKKISCQKNGNGNERQVQNIVMASKLKSLRQIKNMKKLSLASPKKIETCQVGSPIRYKKR